MAVTEREQAAADLDWTPRPGVLRVGDIRVDDALLFIDRGVETMPSYLDLFRRWETQQWSVSDLDFSLDRTDWVKLREFDRQSVLWMRRMFFSGEERVTSTLAPFLWAAPTPEIEMFLSTQILDESRHTLFFDRWFREVVGTGAQDMTESLAKTRPHVNECYAALFDVRLPEAAQRLARVCLQVFDARAVGFFDSLYEGDIVEGPELYADLPVFCDGSGGGISGRGGRIFSGARILGTAAAI